MFYENNNCINIININNSKNFDIKKKHKKTFYTSNGPEKNVSWFPQKYLAAQMFST